MFTEGNRVFIGDCMRAFARTLAENIAVLGEDRSTPPRRHQRHRDNVAPTDNFIVERHDKLWILASNVPRDELPRSFQRRPFSSTQVFAFTCDKVVDAVKANRIFLANGPDHLCWHEWESRVNCPA